MGLSISKNCVVKDENNEIKRTTLGQHGMYITLAKIRMMNVELDGVKGSISFDVPLNTIREDNYDPKRYYIDLKDDEIVVVSRDMGPTGNKLEDGRNEHRWEKASYTINQIKEGLPAKSKYYSFTISKNMARSYERKDGLKMASIVLPEGKLQGYHICLPENCLKEIEGKDHLWKVSVKDGVNYNVIKNVVKSVNPETNQKEYDSKVAETLSAAQVFEYFNEGYEAYKAENEKKIESETEMNHEEEQVQE